MSTSRGVIAAGHPLTAEAGARVLREGGSAVDAAVAAMLTSFAAESPLTGFGAGGFMLVRSGEERCLLDFFVEVPGREGTSGRAELEPIELRFDKTPQVFNCGAASCAVPGTPSGMAEALERFGSASMEELAGPAARVARDGVEVTPGQGGIYSVLAPILTSTPEVAALYAPEGRILRAGDRFRWPDLGDAIERFASEGPDAVMGGEVAERICEWVRDRGGVLSPADMADYRVVEREPVVAGFRGRQVLTNPPPSSGGVLIAFCLEILERLASAGVEEVVGVMEEALGARGEHFLEGLYREEWAAEFLAADRLDAIAERLAAPMARPGSGPERSDRLGSTTHIAVIDEAGNAASVTCSNGSGSGIVVPGTGVHVNNMLGEEDLNPFGFHRVPTGVRMTSMMAPTLILRDGEVEAALGSAGSNRLRSAILQTAIGLIAGQSPQDAIEAPRVHYESGAVQAEQGVEERDLRRLEERGRRVVRWEGRNLYFGGVQAVARMPDGSLAGGGDPRRGGVAVLV